MRTSAALFLLLLVLPACVGSPRRIEQDYDRARQTMWRGDLAGAQKLADTGATQRLAESDSQWHWRFRLLSCEVAILRRDFSAAEAILKDRLPDAPAFDSLRARQRLLDAKLDVERGQFRSAHEKLAQARSVEGSDAEVRLDIDRLDGQALLRLGEWDQGEALLTGVVTAAGGRSPIGLPSGPGAERPRHEPHGPKPLRRGARLLRAGRGDARFERRDDLCRVAEQRGVVLSAPGPVRSRRRRAAARV